MEQEKDQWTPFFDSLIVRKDNVHVKLLIYRKTHIDLQFSFHHPLQQKFSIIRTLLDRSISIITEEAARAAYLISTLRVSE